MDMLQYVSGNRRGLKPSGIRLFAQKAAEREGCISLTLGEPDFETPLPVKDAAKRALDENMTHYSPNSGYMSLRQAIADFEREKKGLSYRPEEIIVTAGATEALNIALGTVLEAGDEVIIPVPAFGLYASIVEMYGGRPVYVDTSSSGFQLDADALRGAISPQTKAIVLNSPNNPTGAVYTKETLDAVHEVLLELPVFVICDEVYDQLTFDDGRGTFAAFDDMRDRIIVVQSFSKPYAMTGWRAGYVMADLPLTKIMELVHQFSVVSVPSFIQPACEEALNWDASPMRVSIKQRSRYVCERLAAMGLPVTEPMGTFYLFPEIREFGMDSETFCLKLIEDEGLALTPGSCFQGEGFVRISCCYPMEVLEEGMERLTKFAARLRENGQQ